MGSAGLPLVWGSKERDARDAEARRLRVEGLSFREMPGWFQVNTPLGNYNPDWAVLVNTHEGERLYFVVETKGSPFLDDLRIPESAKIACGRAHFSALEVRESPARYEVATGVEELLATVDPSRSAPTSSAHDA